jgi:hypothetical protein
MVPNIPILEQLTFEHIGERQHQSEQQRLLAYLQKPRSRYIQRVMESFKALFVVFHTHSKQLERSHEPSA